MADGMSLPTVPWQTMLVNNSMERVQGCFKASEKAPSSDAVNPQLREACAELESLFINYLFKEMRATVPKTGFMSGGKAEEIYTSMLDMELAKELSKKGGMGLSELLARQLGGSGNPGESRMPEKSE